MVTRVGHKGDAICRRVISVVFETPDMHSPPWYWVSSHREPNLLPLNVSW